MSHSISNHRIDWDKHITRRITQLSQIIPLGIAIQQAKWEQARSIIRAREQGCNIRTTSLFLRLEYQSVYLRIKRWNRDKAPLTIYLEAKSELPSRKDRGLTPAVRISGIPPGTPDERL